MRGARSPIRGERVRGERVRGERVRGERVRGERVRGERARVAQRVRAMLADSRVMCDRISGAGPSDGDARLSPWLLSDDLVSRLPPAAPPAAPETSEASASRPVARAHRSSGPVERLSARLVIRADPGRRGAIAVGVAVLVAAVVTGAWVLSSRQHALAVGSTGADPAAVAAARSAAAAGTSLTPEPTRDPASASAARGSAAPTLVVDVAGKVRHPGLYRLPAGSPARGSTTRCRRRAAHCPASI